MERIRVRNCSVWLDRKEKVKEREKKKKKYLDKNQKNLTGVWLCVFLFNEFVVINNYVRDFKSKERFFSSHKE
jgi:hypothetical protein